MVRLRHAVARTQMESGYSWILWGLVLLVDPVLPLIWYANSRKYLVLNMAGNLIGGIHCTQKNTSSWRLFVFEICVQLGSPSILRAFYDLDDPLFSVSDNGMEIGVDLFVL